MQRNVRENLRKGEILVRKCLEFAFGTFDTWQFNLQGMGGNPFDSPLGGGQMFSPDVFSKLNGNGFGMGAEEFGLISADQLKVTRMTHGTLWSLTAGVLTQERTPAVNCGQYADKLLHG